MSKYINHPILGKTLVPDSYSPVMDGGGIDFESSVMPTIQQFEDDLSFGNVNFTSELEEKFGAKKRTDENGNVVTYKGRDDRDYTLAVFPNRENEIKAARLVGSRIWNSDSVSQDPVKFASTYTGLPEDDPTVINYSNEIKRRAGEKRENRATERSFKRTDELAKMFVSTLAPPKIEETSWVDSLPNSIKQAYNQSISGAAYKVMKGKEKHDLSGYNPSMLEDVTAQIASFFMPLDALTLVAGGGIGGTIARKLVLNGVSKKVAQRAVTRGVVKAKAQALNKGITEGTRLGFYDGLREGLETKAQDGSVDLAKVLKASAEGSFIGASMGGVGGALAAKGIKGTRKAAAEITAFGTSMPLAEGELPTPQDYVDASALILGIKGVGKLFGGTKRMYNAFQDITNKHGRKKQVKAIDELAVAEIEASEARVVTQRANPLKTIERIRNAEAKGEKPGRLAETWRSIFSPKDDLVIGDTFTSKTGKKMVPVYNVKTGQALPAMTEEAFFKTHSRSTEAVRLAVAKKPTTIRQTRLNNIEQSKKSSKEGGMQFTDEEIQRVARGSLNKEGKINLQKLTEKDLSKVHDSIITESKLINLKNSLKAEGLHVPEMPKNGTFYRIFQPFRPAERQYGLTNSREGRAFAQAIDVGVNREKVYLGQIVDDLMKLNLMKPKGKLFRFGKEATKYREKIADDMENPAIQTEFNKYMDKLYFKTILPFAKKHKWEIHPYRKNYFPQMLKQDIRDKIFDDVYKIESKFSNIDSLATLKGKTSLTERTAASRYIKSMLGKFDKKTIEALNKIKAKTGEDYLSAFVKLKQYTFNDKFQVFGNLEKARQLNLPKSFFERDAAQVLTRYATKLSKRMSQIEQFGAKSEKADEFFKVIGQKQGVNARNVAHQIYMTYNGTIEANPQFNYSPGVKNFFNKYLGFSVATKIGGGFSTLFNTTQTFISTAVEAGMFRTMKSALRLVSPTKKGKELRSSVVRSGASTYDVIKEISNVQHSNGLLHKVAAVTTVPFNLINKANNVLAAATAQGYVKDLHRIANKSKSASRRKWAVRQLRQFNVNHKKELTDKTIAETMSKFARDSQLQKNVLKDPLAFNNPLMRPFLTFKRFGYRQATYMKRVLMDEANKGNTMPFLRIAAGGWAGGEFVNWARNNIKESLGGEPTVRPTGIYERAVENYTSIGAIGMAAELASGFSKDQSLVKNITYMAKPLGVSDLERIREGMQGVEEDFKNGYGIENALKRNIVQFSKPLGSLATLLSKRLQKKITPEQSDKRLKSLLGREKTSIIDLYVEADKARLRGWKGKAKELEAEAGRKQDDWNNSWDKFGFGLYIMDIKNSDIIARIKTMEERKSPSKREDLATMFSK